MTVKNGKKGTLTDSKGYFELKKYFSRRGIGDFLYRL